MTNPQTAVAVIEQSAEDAVVEWSLDGFPEHAYNRLLPTQTLQIPTDLLRPVVQVVQLNPDPKNGGDVYTSNDTPDGHAAPTKVGLRKLATAAGISFVDERRTDDGRDPDVIEVTCVAEMLLPTGQRIRAVGTKRVDLNAQTWKSPQHRGKFKSFFQEHVASRAENRAIRALLSLRGSYPIEIYQRPFAVVSFAPNMAHPEVRARILDAMVPVAAQLYGAQAPQLAPGAPIDVTPAPEEDPAPATPPTMPGEKLAAAAPATTEEPSWMQYSMGTQPATKAAPPRPARDVVDVIRDTAAASGMQGAMTPPQATRLRELLGILNGTGVVPVALVAIFGAGELDAAQAQALINHADGVGADVFVEQFRAVAERAKAAA
jgi:hypothetical protein